MAAHQDHCGTFVVDPYDIDAECCMHASEPVRPHETVTADVTLTNHEESTVEGTLNWALSDAKSGEIVDPLDGKTLPFKLESGEEKDFEIDVTPEESSVVHTRIKDYDDEFVASIWYALEDVRSPDEEKTHSGGEAEKPDGGI